MSRNDAPAPEATQPTWATTVTAPYAVDEADRGGLPPASGPAAPEPAQPAPPASAPALNPPTWSGRKTAIAAALAIGISTAGAIGAAAAVPAGSSSQTGGPGGQFQRGGFGPGGQFPGGGPPPGAGLSQQIPGGTQQQLPAQPSQPRVAGQSGQSGLPGQPVPNASTT